MGSFADQLASFAAQTKGDIDTVTAGGVHEVGQRLIDRTPKDTGQAKSNWNYSIETPDQHTTTQTGVRTINGIEDLPKRAAAFIHYVTNSLPYIPALERGHSKQAPQGMVGLTALEWPQIVADQALKVKR